MTGKSATGPMSPEEFDRAVNAPFGAAKAIIRQHDPLWGRPGGEKFKWSVRMERPVTEIGYATVEAATEDEALDAACLLSDRDVTTDRVDSDPSDAWDAVSAKPL